jgi:hypothetical protein
MLTIENIHKIEGERVSCAFTSQKNWRIMQVVIWKDKYEIHLAEVGKVSNWITMHLERNSPECFDKKYPLKNDRDDQYRTLYMKDITRPSLFMDKLRNQLERF